MTGAVALGTAVLGGSIANAQEVGAGQWSITPRAALEETFTSNVRLAPKGDEEADFITRVSPGISIRGRTPTLRLGLDYDPEFLLDAKTSEGNGFRNNLAGYANSVFFDRRLAIDASASIVQTFANPIGSVSGSELLTIDSLPTQTSDVTVNNNLVEARSFTLSPAWRQRLGSIADAELRYRFGVVSVDDEDVSDTITNLIAVSVRGLSSFTSNFSWGLRASQEWTDRSGGRTGIGGTGGTSLDDTSTERRLGRIDLGYQVVSGFSLIGGIGWEEIEDESLSEPPDGLIWDIGFEYRLRPRSFIRATYGRRFDDQNFDVQSNWQLGATTALRVSYTESLQTSQTSLLNRTALIGVDDQGNLVDIVTGLPFRPDDRTLGLTSQTFREERFQAALTSVRGRNSYSAIARYQTRTAEAPSDDSEETLGAGLSWSRRLTRQLDLDAQLDYRNVKFGGTLAGEDDLYTFSTGLGLKLSETASVQLRVRHTERESTEAVRELRETLVSLRLAKSF